MGFRILRLFGSLKRPIAGGCLKLGCSQSSLVWRLYNTLRQGPDSKKALFRVQREYRALGTQLQADSVGSRFWAGPVAANPELGEYGA